MAVDTFDIVYKRGARAAVAEDIDELAYLPEEWGYDGEAIGRRCSNFNRALRRGDVDPPREFDATPIDPPPFYVVEAVPAITFTFGGVRVDDVRARPRQSGRADPGIVRRRRGRGRRLRPRVRRRPRRRARVRAARGADGARARAERWRVPLRSCPCTSGGSTTVRTSCGCSRPTSRSRSSGRRRTARASSRGRSTSGASTWSSASPRGSGTTSATHCARARSEVATGWTTRHGEPLGTFTFTVELDGEGRARRLFAARTEAFGGVPF